MTGAALLLARIRKAGGEVTVIAGRLRLKAPTRLPPELIASARAHKVELLALLAANERDGWGLTGADRAAASARLHGRPETSTTSDRELSSPPAAKADGLPRALRQRPPSWADPAVRPSPDSVCSCCKGQRWWCELQSAKGWRCWACHPPDHLPTNAIEEVRMPRA